MDVQEQVAQRLASPVPYKMYERGPPARPWLLFWPISGVSITGGVCTSRGRGAPTQAHSVQHCHVT